MEDIIKEKGTDGEMIYKFPNGEKIETWKTALEDIVTCGIEKMEMVFKLLELDNVDIESVYHIGMAVTRDTRAQFNEANDFIEKNFGSIEIEGAVANQIGIEDLKMLGVVFKTNNQDK